jgi:hypothetical protein
MLQPAENDREGRKFEARRRSRFRPGKLKSLMRKSEETILEPQMKTDKPNKPMLFNLCSAFICGSQSFGLPAS